MTFLLKTADFYGWRVLTFQEISLRVFNTLLAHHTPSPTIRRGQWAMTCAVFIEQNSCFFDMALTYSSAVAGGVAGGSFMSCGEDYWRLQSLSHTL